MRSRLNSLCALHINALADVNIGIPGTASETLILSMGDLFHLLSIGLLNLMLKEIISEYFTSESERRISLDEPVFFPQ